MVISKILDFFLHLDQNLYSIIQTFGIWSYFILFAIIFFETGLVITPFLPGDSLLFAAGTFAAIKALNLYFLLIILILAAVAGDTVNYFIGNYVGPKVFNEKSRLFKKEHLLRTKNFYEKYGGKTIILARFVPIFRTFAPFIAGIGKMKYKKFLLYNLIGGIMWVLLLTCAGYFFGNIPFVKNNFEIVILAIIILSIMPALIEFIRSKHKN